MNHMVTIDR